MRTVRIGRRVYMKTMHKWLWLILLLFALSACSAAGDDTKTEKTETITEADNTEITEETSDTEKNEPETEEAVTEPKPETAVSHKAVDFFYKDTDWRAFYSGKEAAADDFSIIPQYSDGNRLQIAICGDNPSCDIQVWEVGDQYVAWTVSTEEAWFRKNLLPLDASDYNNGLDDPLVYLKDPIEVGHQWQSGHLHMEIVEVQEKTQEHGARVVVENQTEDEAVRERYTIEEGRWIVKKEVIRGEDITVSELDRYEAEPQVYPVNLYYPNSLDTDGDSFTQVSVQAPFPVNASNREILADLYKNHVPDDGIPVLKAEDTINSLYLNQDGNVYIDLSRSFADMNAGSSGEPLILKAMGFTAADLMKGKEGVILTLDNQLYEGGHVSFEKGQTIPAVPGEQDYIRTMEE